MPHKSGNGTEKYEKTDVSSVAIAATGLLAILACWALFDAMGTFFRVLKRSNRPTTGMEASIVEERGLPPNPRLQEDPRADLGKYLKTERELLGSYGWVDRGAGVARVPVSRAMETISDERP